MANEQVDVLIEQLRCRRDLAMIRLMLDGGLRPGEVLGLNLTDLGYGRRRVTIRVRFDHPRGVRSKSRTERCRFRHTLGTELAERDAKLHTIMGILGHESPQMTMVYARISNAEVLRDYRPVLEPGAMIAGAGAEAIRAGELTAEAVDWLRSNFLKTELELGHCLRLPSEGPCECDLYLSCSRFVTTPAYASRLQERHRLELSLADDARMRTWPREVERHCGIARRIEQLLEDLGEAVEANTGSPPI